MKVLQRQRKRERYNSQKKLGKGEEEKCFVDKNPIKTNYDS